MTTEERRYSRAGIIFTHRFRWLIFDLDGTLFDYDRAELTALGETCAEHTLDFNPDLHRLYCEINSDLWRQFEEGAVSSLELRTRRFELLFAELGVTMNAERFSSDYLKRLGQQTFTMADALTTVTRLSEDHEIVFATNGIAEVQRSRMAASPLSRVGAELVISEEIGAAKPDPQFFAELFERIGSPPKSEALVIGDSLSSDIAGGAGFGLATCWFNPDGVINESDLRADYEIPRLRDLIIGRD